MSLKKLILEKCLKFACLKLYEPCTTVKFVQQKGSTYI